MSNQIEEKIEEKNNVSTKPNPKTNVQPVSQSLLRLKNERRSFRKDHPFGMSAKPNQKDGNIDWYNWEATFYGK